MKLNVIPEPAANTRLVFVADRAPIARGHGLDRFECGACGDLLLVQTSLRDIVGAVFRCPSCGAYNEAPEPTGAP